MDLLTEDIGNMDITTFGLEIGNEQGRITFSPKETLILSGVSEVEKIVKKLDVKYKFYKKESELVHKGELILEVKGTAANLHKIWKISQNIFEYMSGIATYTYEMTNKGQKINPNIIIATTRKNFPSAKKLMIQAVLDGGGVVHRLGLYDSILVFKEHLEFICDDTELIEKFSKLKRKFLEKKITVEVDSFEEALKFTTLGADILQCEKMDFEELERCVSLKQNYPHILISATGGITLENIEKYVQTGVDFVVTSSPYHAKPCDVKVTIKADKSWMFVHSI